MAHRWEPLDRVWNPQQGTEVCSRCGCMKTGARMPSPGGTRIVTLYSWDWGATWDQEETVPHCDTDYMGQFTLKPWQAKHLDNYQPPQRAFRVCAREAT